MEQLTSFLRLSRYLPPRDDGGPYRPSPPQAAFLLLDCKEALYGGAAGGGKSDALLAAALQYVDVPGYTALILRRSFRDLALPDAIMHRAKRWLRPHRDVRWSEKDKTFTFPSGATLTFGYLEKEGDELSYQGSAYQYVAFDELTQFQEAQYLYLFSRLRKPEDLLVPLRMRAATNPGGPGHEWVKLRFNLGVDPATGRRLQPPAGRAFIPAKLADNANVDRASYEASLAELDPITRARLLNGDWGARPPGEMFQRDWFKIIDARPQAVRWVRRWDFASTAKRRASQDPDFTAGCLMGRLEDDRVVIADMLRFRADPGDTEKRFLQTAANDGRAVAIRWEQEPGSAGKMLADLFVRKLMGYDAAGIPSTGDKTIRARPLASYAHRELVLLVSGTWVPDFLAEVEAFPQESVHDDQVDAASGAFEDLGGIGPVAGASAPPPPRAQAAEHTLSSPYHAQRGTRLSDRIRRP